jgi:hypothetical protein
MIRLKISTIILKLNLMTKPMAISLYIPSWFTKMKSTIMIIYAKNVSPKESNWTSIWETWASKKFREIFRNFDSALVKNARKMFTTSLSIKIDNQMHHLQFSSLLLNILTIRIKVITKIVPVEIYRKLKNNYKSIFLFLLLRANW